MILNIPGIAWNRVVTLWSLEKPVDRERLALARAAAEVL